MGETLAVPSAHDERWYRRGSWVVVCLVVLLLVAGALHGQIWFDESYSVALARESLADIWRIGAADVHPVLYYVALFTVWKYISWNTTTIEGSNVTYLYPSGFSADMPASLNWLGWVYLHLSDYVLSWLELVFIWRNIRGGFRRESFLLQLRIYRYKYFIQF